jgi:fructokinase
MSGYRGQVITVIGEALVDLVTGDPQGDAPDPTVQARLGGGSYNTARTIGRLGVPVSFAGRLADDPFGRLLRAGLSESGVTIGVPRPTAAPTTLAVVSVAADGTAEYRFYLDGASVADLEYRDLLTALDGTALASTALLTTTLPTTADATTLPATVDATTLPATVDAATLPATVDAATPPATADAAAPPATVDAVYLGGLWLVRDPLATSISSLAAGGLPAGALLMVDPNCRPDAIGSDREAYLAQVTGLAGRTDILKASVEDLAYISPAQSAADAAAGLLAAGVRLVLVTDGPRPVRAFLPSGVVTAEVPPVVVADTIGAGDAFGGAFLAWWTASGRGRGELADPAVVAGALGFAASVSALTCTRPGADPPRMPVT